MNAGVVPHAAVFLLKIPEMPIESLDGPRAARWPLEVLSTSLSVLTSEVKRRRAELVLGWGPAWEDLRVQSFRNRDPRISSAKVTGSKKNRDCLTRDEAYSSDARARRDGSHRGRTARPHTQ